MKIPWHRATPSDPVPIIESTIAHWQYLDDDERWSLVDLTKQLLRLKHWETAGGLEMIDTIPVVVAAQAALLVLGRSIADYRFVDSIIVYPSAVISTGTRMGPAGTLTDEPLAIHGLANNGRGPILIAWDQALAAARHPCGHNVVFHEFAHKLDTIDGLADGTPPVESILGTRWVDVCTPIFESLRAGVTHPPLRGYGAENPAEFFAVATEAFFDASVTLRANEPALYDLLAEFFAQNPADRFGRH